MENRQMALESPGKCT